MSKISFLLFFLFTGSFAMAQKKPLIVNYEEVVDRAKAELDSSMKSGELRLFAEKHPISGEYVFDITIHEKGKVLSVFAVSNSTNNIRSQNILKDFIRSLNFNFKLAAGKNYKFQYRFQFP